MNLRAQLGDQVMVFTYLFIMVMVAGSIVGGVVLFYGTEIDFRPTEVQLLTRAVDHCLTLDTFNWDKAQNDSSYFFTVCNLNKSALESHTNQLKVCVNSKGCISEPHPLIAVGSDFLFCGLSGVQANEKLPRCLVSSLVISGKNVQIIASSNQKATQGVA